MTELLNWQDTSNGSKYERSAEYRGYTIKAWLDDCGDNPWQEWDAMTPLLYFSERSIETFDSGDNLESPIDRMTDGFLKRHQRKICDILNIDWQEMHDDCKDSMGERCLLIDHKRDAINDALSDMNGNYWGSVSDYFDALESLYSLLKIPALSTQVSGYSQGDSVLMLLVATPEHKKRCGYKKHKAEWFESNKNLFASWAFGDVYGFTVKDCDDMAYGGFYGSDYNESGLEQAAIEAIDVEINYLRKQRINKIKELIKNNVPIFSRPQILAAAT